MSTSRLFSVFVALALVVVAALTVRAGIATSEVASSPKAVLGQQERHPAVVNPSAALAEQARLEYRRGEWYVVNSSSSAFDVEQARIGWRTSASQARNAVQARWLTQHGSTHRTCVLLCGGQ